ncbi:MAG: S8 family serine peptidase, partial [Desulfatitalea sp.]|nr:S8 family serine peptidase [Desulfatitalea sp.]
MGLFLGLIWGCGGGGGGGDAPALTYTVSGTIYSAAGNAVARGTNNNFGSAQTLRAPVLLGGFVDADAQSGRSHFFRVDDLPAHARIRLALPDGTAPDLARVALYLYSPDDTGAPLAELSHVAQTAALVVDVAGDYYIEVRAVHGATIYRLILDVTPAMVHDTGLEATADFVPGEVLVQMASDGDRRRGAAMANAIRDSGLRVVGASRNGWLRLRDDNMGKRPERLNGGQSKSSDGGRSMAIEIERRRWQQATLRLVQAMQSRPDVRHAQPNYIRRPLFEPNDPLYPLQWHLDLIQLPAAWGVTRGDAGVIVAVLDTGALLDHPDLKNKWVAGYDFVDGDNDPHDPGDGAAGNSSFHGTHVAGIVAAAFDNDEGVAGVGGATRIMPVRVLGPDGGNDNDIAKAIRWAAGLELLDDDGNLILAGANPRADIINMSFGGQGSSEILQLALREARDAGVILIAAAGNQATNTPYYPAAYPEVISVTAVDTFARRAYYANYGNLITLSAPGGDMNTDSQPDSYADGILSTLGSDAGATLTHGYGYYQGTSMAAAHMSGVAALMKALRPGLSPAELDGYIASGQVIADLAPDGTDAYYGHGLIDAYAAVTAARNDPPEAHLTVLPRALHLAAAADTAGLFLRKAGSGDLAVEIHSGPDWLTIASTAETDDDGFGPYQVAVDRPLLAAGQGGGLHTGTLVFETAANTVTVPVTVAVLPDPGASAGTQYLLLIDTATMEPVARRVLSAVNGSYP